MGKWYRADILFTKRVCNNWTLAVFSISIALILYIDIFLYTILSWIYICNLIYILNMYIQLEYFFFLAHSTCNIHVVLTYYFNIFRIKIYMKIEWIGRHYISNTWILLLKILIRSKFTELRLKLVGIII